MVNLTAATASARWDMLEKSAIDAISTTRISTEIPKLLLTVVEGQEIFVSKTVADVAQESLPAFHWVHVRLESALVIVAMPERTVRNAQKVISTLTKDVSESLANVPN